MENDNLPSNNTNHDKIATSASNKPLTGKIRALLAQMTPLRVLAALAVIAIVATIIVFREQIGDLDKETLEPYGYLGAFLINLIAAASIFLPVPGILVIAGLGEMFNPYLIGLAGGAGAALGELTGYLAGYSGQTIAENHRLYPRLEKWMRRRGSLVIFIFSALPNPFFDIVGAGAGVLRYPLARFLIVCFAGKVINSTMVALFGGWGFSRILDWFK